MKSQRRRKPKSSCWPWSGSGAAAIAGVMVTAAIVAPARAAVLNTWSFNIDTRQLTITLPEGVTPNYFLLAEPARIVLDMPGMTLGSMPLAQEYTGAIRSIRFSEILGGSRVIVELAPYTLLDPRHAELVAADVGNGLTRWTLQPLIQDDQSIAPIAAAEPDAPPPVSVSSADVPATPPVPPNEAVEVPSSPVPETLEDFARSVDVPVEEPDFAPVDETSIPNLPPTPSVSDDGASELPETADLPETAPTSSETTVPDDAFEPIVEESAEPIRVTPPEQPASPEEPVSAANAEPIRVTPPEEAAGSVVTSLTEPNVTQPLLSSPPSLDTTASDVVASPVEDPPTSASVPQIPAVPARPLPTGPDPLQGVRTDASVLADVDSEEPSDILPDRPDSLPTTTQPSVSVPPLRDRPSSPQVAVPSIADVPAPPQSETTTASPAEAVAIPVPPAAEPEELSAIASAVPEPPLSSSAPTTPVEPATSNLQPNEIRPPQATVTASVPLAVETPTVAETPPFLASSGNVPSTEQSSIPPPPTGDASSRVVPFGTPLPGQDKSIEETTLPAGMESIGTIPVGTRLILQYPGTEPLKLTQEEPWYEVLILAEDVLHPTTNERLLLKGTQVIGRFEGLDDSGRRFVSQVFVEAGGDRRALLAESDWLAGVAQPDGDSLLTNSGIGAAAITVLSGFSGIGLLGGAALGAASSFATAPRVVTVEPGQLIRVEVVSDILPL